MCDRSEHDKFMRRIRTSNMDMTVMRHNGLLFRRFVRLMLVERNAPGASGSSRTKNVISGTRPTPPTGVWLDWDPKNPKKYREGNRDTGPGEEKIAWELGGSTQGHSVSYDVVDQDGNKWEVKEPNASDMIRPGVEGRRAVEAMRHAIEEICRQLSRGFARIDFSTLAAYEDSSTITAAEVKEFIDYDIGMIMSGELSQGRLVGKTRKNPVGLLQVLEYVRHMIGDATHTPKRKISWNGSEREVDVGTYVHTSRELGMDDSDLDVEVSDLFAGTFRHPAFLKPRTFIKDVWAKGVQASTVFGNVSGLVLVSPTQYMLVPHAELDDHLRFLYISKGEPRFEVVG